MPEFDYTSVWDRHGLDALAVDCPGKGGRFAGMAPTLPREGFSLIPMWIADMNFATAPAVIEAIDKRLQHPLFGYFGRSEEYYEAVKGWQQRRNGVEALPTEAIGFENGVQGGLVSAVDAVCCPGDKILIHAPTYVGFTRSLENKGYRLVLSELKRDAEGVWRMDYADMEEKLKTQQIRLAVLCSPHNPTGRVWERRELEQAMELFQKYDCTVVSDEIWSDLLLDGRRHVPTQSISEDARSRTVALYSPTKAFNLAGLVESYHIIYNPRLRERVSRHASLSQYNAQNVLSMHALIGAYSAEGEAWLDGLCAELSRNIRYVCEQLRTHCPELCLSTPEGTYILFLDCEKWCATHHKSMDELLKAGWDVGVGWQDGRPFHAPWSIRINLALPRSLLEEAVQRMLRYVF